MVPLLSSLPIELSSPAQLELENKTDQEHIILSKIKKIMVSVIQDFAQII